MKSYLILPNIDQDNVVAKYVEEKAIAISIENILTVDEFINLGDYPCVAFFVKYDSTKRSHIQACSDNKLSSGYNISVGGDDHLYKIDRKLIEPEPNEMNLIIKRYRNKVRQNTNIETNAPNQKNHRGKIIAINSTKGGVGKSFISFSLGYVASKIKKNNKKILLIDYNLSEGSLSRYFWESSQHAGKIDSLIDYYISYGAIDSDYLKDIIINNPKLTATGEVVTGLDVLFAPDNFVLTPRKINSNPGFNVALFDALKELYDVVIIDTSNEKNIPVNDYLIQVADKLLFVISPNPNSVIQAKEYIEELGLNRDKYDIVYNDYNHLSERFGKESIASSMYRLDTLKSGKREEIKKVMSKKFYILDTNMGIKRADHHWDTIFNKSKKYISAVEMDKYKKVFYQMLKNSCPNDVLDLDEVSERRGIFEKISAIFKS